MRIVSILWTIWNGIVAGGTWTGFRFVPQWHIVYRRSIYCLCIRWHWLWSWSADWLDLFGNDHLIVLRAIGQIAITHFRLCFWHRVWILCGQFGLYRAHLFEYVVQIFSRIVDQFAELFQIVVGIFDTVSTQGVAVQEHFVGFFEPLQPWTRYEEYQTYILSSCEIQ